jgi:hypothetical protein
MAFSYAEIFEDSDIEHLFAAALIPFAGGMLGLSVNTLTSGDIPRTVETTPSSENVGIGSVFSWTSTAAGFTYAQLITDRLGFGLTGKWVNEGIDGAEANWFAIDLGVKFNTGLYGTTSGGGDQHLGQGQDERLADRAAAYRGQRDVPGDGTHDWVRPVDDEPGAADGLHIQAPGGPVGHPGVALLTGSEAQAGDAARYH